MTQAGINEMVLLFYLMSAEVILVVFSWLGGSLMTSGMPDNWAGVAERLRLSTTGHMWTPSPGPLDFLLPVRGCQTRCGLNWS